MSQEVIPLTTEARNAIVREAWHENAAFWDECNGERKDSDLVNAGCRHVSYFCLSSSLTGHTMARGRGRAVS
jgi:hypothetical protein